MKFIESLLLIMSLNGFASGACKYFSLMYFSIKFKHSFEPLIPGKGAQTNPQ